MMLSWPWSSSFFVVAIGFLLLLEHLPTIANSPGHQTQKHSKTFSRSAAESRTLRSIYGLHATSKLQSRIAAVAPEKHVNLARVGTMARDFVDMYGVNSFSTTPRMFGMPPRVYMVGVSGQASRKRVFGHEYL